MKITLKQKLQTIEKWLDQVREDEKVSESDKELVTVPIGKSKIFLDKNSKKNDKIQLDFIIIKRSELSMVDTKMIETIYKLAINDNRKGIAEDVKK
jgi:hypothetical protein